MSNPVAEETIEKPIEESEDIVNPWEVVGKSLTGIDYDKLIRRFYLQFNKKKSDE